MSSDLVVVRSAQEAAVSLMPGLDGEYREETLDGAVPIGPTRDLDETT
jgi:hypothetical protein